MATVHFEEMSQGLWFFLMFFSIKCLIFVLPNSIVLCNLNYIINICCMKYVCLDNLLDRRDIQNIGDLIFYWLYLRVVCC